MYSSTPNPIVAAALLAFVISTPVSAEEKEKAPDPDAITCKYEKVVGSQIPTKVCLTNFEWEDRRRAQLEAQRSSRNNNSGCDGERC